AKTVTIAMKPVKLNILLVILGLNGTNIRDMIQSKSIVAGTYPFSTCGRPLLLKNCLVIKIFTLYL
ncbi:hypothetical protein JZM27_08630, partial [Providencia huaxiensis]|uniref:hypothetical protein n=1 Tax=Providencia huaxiensis TaxID=2027290 RepID=UPI0019D2DDCE